MSKYHISVLLQETLDLLHIQKNKKYIDATLGGGGHTQAILERGGKVLGIDFDQDALDFVKKELLINKQEIRDELILAKGNFKDIDKLASENDFIQVSGILFDLGISSHHVDSAERGFSFQKEAVLDMRMDQDLSVKAGDLINILTKGELYELFTKLGEERFARSISDSIIRARKISPIKTTTELATIINRSIPRKQTTINGATRVFQALRIAVNDELNNIREALPKALDLLEEKGRIAVISFHSLEDRIIKNQFKEWEEQKRGTILTKKPITASEEEIERNNRSRSAKLRVFEKL
ncbi:MAG TPA: 16S rRNA (cytosine(1402)-N(4))-methyltransferase RsmH [Methylomirabilota bacterium]|nr:16S rRNA (cytosine(1402)-N(4))-methyltransferase RsmH [Methylomirabilota bacterium]